MKNVFFIYILTSLVILSNYVNAQMMINLNKYKEENSSLGLPKQGENRIVFMGNSITEDWKSMLILVQLAHFLRQRVIM